ncbi:MAG: hypothetical protein WC423_26990, partial [Vulcanimicrobiota bacterium]
SQLTHRSSPTSTRPVSTECGCQPQDMMEIGKEKYTPEKDKIIRSMLRRAPDEEAVCDVVEALSVYPESALKRVAEFGTRLEVYDEDSGDQFPNYMPTLPDPRVVGAYNTVANVLGMEDDDLSPFVLIHEFAHALDASMGEVSEQGEWKGAHRIAKATKQAVRDYATFDSSEYLAENTTAYLVADEALHPLVEKGLQEEIAMEGMSVREYIQMHQNYSNSRLQQVDPTGYEMVDKMFKNLEQLPPPQVKKAMDEAEFQVFLDQRKAS